MHKKGVWSAVLAVIMTASSAMSVMADDSGYILFLPSADDADYKVDDSHVSEKYSTDDYTILFYEQGDMVRFKVNPDKKFTISDALDNGNIVDAKETKDGTVTFLMPDKDLCFAFTGSSENGSTDENANESSGDKQDSNTDGKETVITANGVTAQIKMADGTTDEIGTDSSKGYNDVIDTITIKNEGGISDPEIAVSKNGENVDDLSNILFTQGGGPGYYVFDLKNSIMDADDSFTFTVSDGTPEKKSESEEPSEQDMENTESSEEETTETEIANPYYEQVLAKADQNGETRTEKTQSEQAVSETETEPGTDSIAITSETETVSETIPEADSGADAERSTVADVQYEPETDPDTKAVTGTAGNRNRFFENAIRNDSAEETKTEKKDLPADTDSETEQEAKNKLESPVIIETESETEPMTVKSSESGSEPDAVFKIAQQITSEQTKKMKSTEEAVPESGEAVNSVSSELAETAASETAPSETAPVLNSKTDIVTNNTEASSGTASGAIVSETSQMPENIQSEASVPDTVVSRTSSDETNGAKAAEEPAAQTTATANAESYRTNTETAASEAEANKELATDDVKSTTRTADKSESDDNEPVIFTVSNLYDGTEAAARLASGERINIGKQLSVTDDVISVTVEGDFTENSPVLAVTRNGITVDSSAIVEGSKMLEDGNFFISLKSGIIESGDEYTLTIE